MPRRITAAELDHAAELYASGESFDQVAAALGRKSSDGVRLALQRRGVVARPKEGRPAHNRIKAPADLLVVYEAGESVLAMSQRYSVSRGVVCRWLAAAGLPIRDASEAGRIRMSQLSASERRQLAAPAHAAIRSREREDQWQEAIAAGRERVQYGGRTSPGTDRLCTMLDNVGVEHTREKAVGRYNVDVALTGSRVAVEVLGGNWHGSKGIHARRTPDILNRGWHIVFVWDLKRCQVGTGALDYVVAFAERAGSDPAGRREYRVIRGDGKFLASGQADDDEFPLVPPSVADLN